jgi:tryptophan-rich sensory protein
VLGLAGLAAGAALTALVGAFTAPATISRYGSLARPSWAPPGWLLGPVRTALYAMSAVAGWLAWRRSGLGRTFIPNAVQLVLNAA